MIFYTNFFSKVINIGSLCFEFLIYFEAIGITSKLIAFVPKTYLIYLIKKVLRISFNFYFILAQSAELYDAEGQHDIAFEKYQTALGLLIPLLSKEPKSDRKTVLTQEIKKWMSRAETLKDIKALEEKVLNDNISESVLDKQCLIQ